MKKQDSSKTKMILVPIVILSILGLVLFLSAGSFQFWEAKVYWAGFSIVTIFITCYFLKKSPELLSRRTKYGEKASTKKPPAILNLCLLCYVIPGMDFRWHWSSMPLWLVIVGEILVLLGYVFIFFVFKENAYASTIIQIEKEQKVISSGPYRMVRHPMYVGLLMIILFTPIALGSYWAIFPALLAIPMNVLRIRGEEEALVSGLPGYKEYCEKTRYRLIPFIW